MFKKIRLRKVARQLANLGSIVDTSYMIEVNNEPALTFPTNDDVIAYLSKFRENNVIFRLKIYRVAVYSL